jgi:hypothetical protein
MFGCSNNETQKDANDAYHDCTAKFHSLVADNKMSSLPVGDQMGFPI